MTNPIDTTATERTGEPSATVRPSAGLDLGTAERFDPKLIPGTREGIADLVKRCMQTDNPREAGIPPAFHGGLAIGIHAALTEFRDIAVESESDDYIRAIDTIAPLFEAFINGGAS